MMKWFNIIRMRLRALFLRESVLRDIEEEFRIHVELEAEANIERGMSPDEARAAALKSFGNQVRNTERGYAIRGGGWLESLWQDLRYGMRMLLKSPAFTLTAILSLAIGIGANTALFSVVNDVLWRPLPYPHAERLVSVEGYRGADFAALSEANRVFDGLAAWLGRSYLLTGRGPAAQLFGVRVTPELMSLLGVTLQAGRAFAAEEFRPGHEQVAIISDRLWRNRFSANPQIIGQAVTLDDRSYTVIGVAPPRFNFFPYNDLFTPLVFNAEDLNPNSCCIDSVARLKQGITLEQAQRELAVIVTGFVGTTDARRLQPLRESLVKGYRLTLLAFWGVTGFVLLIACANLANLMLARAANRRKELAVRAVIGAQRLRLIRQLLTESVLVALLGGALGLLVAYFGVRALSAANPVIHQLSLDPIPNYDPTGRSGIGLEIFLYSTPGISRIPRLDEVKIDGVVMFFTFALALLTGTLFGLAPALQFSRPDLSHALKDGAAVSGAGFGFRRRVRFQNLLVIGEVALTILLLAGAGLLIRSIWRLHEEKLGFQPEKVLAMELQFPSFKYRDRATITSFVTQLTERLAALPSVKSVGAADTVPLLKKGGAGSIVIEGKTDYVYIPKYRKAPADTKPLPKAFFSEISPNYIRAMGIPLLRGREFDARDNRQSLPVVIINESLAHKNWPGENPVGKRFKLFDENSWRTVVGVVGDVKRYALEYQTIPEFYFPLLQPREESAFDLLRVGTYVVIRGARRPEDLVEATRQTVWSLDRDLPIEEIATMDERVADVIAPRRFDMLIFGVFAFVALLLAVIGIYGVIAYSVA
ncbi:MAG: ABC transporter permease, partial [Blastocatellia bacterium]|nr:ABC transporter permease [Blastocatellia bacterium]